MSTPHHFPMSNHHFEYSASSKFYTVKGFTRYYLATVHLSFSQGCPRSTFIATMFSGVITVGIIPTFSRRSCLFSSSNDVTKEASYRSFF